MSDIISLVAKFKLFLCSSEASSQEYHSQKGKHNARVIKRAQILLASHRGSKDTEIAARIGITIRTVERVIKNQALII